MRVLSQLSFRLGTKSRWLFIAAVAGGILLSVSVSNGEDKPKPPKKPELLLTLPDICPTPDGMAMDSDGNIILACPN